MLSDNKTYVKKKLSRFNQAAEEREAERRASKNKKPYLNLITAPIETRALGLIPEIKAKEIKIAVINIIHKRIIVGVFEMTDKVQKELKKLEDKGYQPEVFIVSESGLKHAWSFYEYISKKQSEIIGLVKVDEKIIKKLEKEIETVARAREKVESLNYHKIEVAQFVEMMLGMALSLKVSDIHLEPKKEMVNLRMRLDGILNDITSKIDFNFYKKVISRIKLLSGLRLNVEDETQDGRFTIQRDRDEIEVRVAIAPSEYGEVVVMRVLDPTVASLGIQELGFLEHDIELVKKVLKDPNGLVLNTGPTGSGKTTTLYAFLREKVTSEIKVITIEDPIEYHLEGVEQTQVDRESGYTFASGLKSILRQDPDVILVGEIRDEETADIAINASLTGHLVFSTLHTNDASGAIPRLVDLKVRESVLGSALKLIIGQRLARRVCRECRVPEVINQEIEAKIETIISRLPKRINQNYFKKPYNLYKVGKGRQECRYCNGTGYKGRVGLFEMLQVSEEMQYLIEEKKSIFEIKKFARGKGMVTMQEDGILKAIKGITTLEEVERATGEIE